MADHLNTTEGGANINTACHRTTAIGSTTPARRRNDPQWADTVVSYRYGEEHEQQQGDAMGTLIVTVIGLAGVAGLLWLCWWLANCFKWVS